MLHTCDTLTLVSSLLLRASIWIFLRWIVPPLATALALVYVPSFFVSFQDTALYKVISDELDIIVKETVGRGDSTPSSSGEVELLDGAVDGPLEELDVQETIKYEEREPKVIRTLLTGLPSPSSALWSWITFGINMALLTMALDVVYRAPVLHPCHNASFGRVGYVSDNSANILVREPYAFDVKVLYRSVDEQPRSWMHKTLAASKPDYWLTNDTDFTSVVKVDHLRSDTPYEYVIETSSGNVTGTFTTAPRPGHISSLRDNKYTFVHSSCIKPRVPYTPFQHPLEFPGLAHLARWLPELRPYFMLFLGDFIYVDVPHRLGKDAEDYRREYRQVYSSPSWPAVGNDLPWIHVIDDHEIANDWSDNTTGLYSAAYDAFTHYHAAPNPPAHRHGETYFSFTQGPAQFFLMDTRRYRSPANKDPHDQSKSMLGEHQLADLLAWIRKPAPRGVHWKIIVTGVPFTKNWKFGSEDTWGGHLVERRKILEAAWDLSSDGGVGVVVLSGDRHEFAATSFPPPKDSKWPISATVHEFSTSPLSMFYLPFRTYSEIDEEDVCIKYLPDGNNKFGAIEITAPPTSEQSLLNYRLFIDGKESWTHVISTPPTRDGSHRAKDAVWG
ncbi:PhoD-like phosphatase-domain-containing protein [Massariosphaeria phaeospora]|uniref:PhoD-like phosphatase-domain-containing protein n=1 Tax=Massariosphaeria phaeospora TaxID=100035 RepID=A0A7C8I8Y0_9PLEO|nr:PhoD-like phosphatase-domain-containing protein [Massariosphaeria phaeospora]